MVILWLTCCHLSLPAHCIKYTLLSLFVDRAREINSFLERNSAFHPLPQHPRERKKLWLNFRNWTVRVFPEVHTQSSTLGDLGKNSSRDATRFSIFLCSELKHPSSRVQNYFPGAKRCFLGAADETADGGVFLKTHSNRRLWTKKSLLLGHYQKFFGLRGKELYFKNAFSRAFSIEKFTGLMRNSTKKILL